VRPTDGKCWTKVPEATASRQIAERIRRRKTFGSWVVLRTSARPFSAIQPFITPMEVFSAGGGCVAIRARVNS
jgi:hypothetical protein